MFSLLHANSPFLLKLESLIGSTMRCPEGIAESANADCALGPHLIDCARDGPIKFQKNISPFPWEGCQPAGLSISRKTNLEGVYLWQGFGE